MGTTTRRVTRTVYVRGIPVRVTYTVRFTR